MATLTEVSAMARKGIKWGTVALVIMALIPGTITLIKKAYLMLNPPPPPPPTVRYGKLPKLILPEAPNFATPEYRLETITGSLPSLPNVSKVYLVGINKSRLLVLDRMSQKAKAANLTNGPIQLDERTYRYTNPNYPIDMIFDVINGALSYKFDWTSDKKIYTNFDIPIGVNAVSEAKRFLSKLGVLQEDLASDKAPNKLVYLAATSSAMVPGNSVYESNFVRVDLFRQDKDDMRIVTVGGDTSPVNVILSGVFGDERVVQANYYYSQTIDGDYATYPLRSVDQAWKELVSGGGFIAKRTTENQVVVRKVSLAYFESNEQQAFLQPVYVFEGDGGFTAYVQAVDHSYINE